MTDGIRIPFSGQRSGMFELTWGQQDGWRVMSRSALPSCVGGIEELQPGTTVEGVVAVTRFVLTRHEALRSRLRFHPDGRPYQELFATGEYVVELVDAGTRDPGEVAAEISHRFTHDAFDYVNEWPVRMAIVAKDGVLTHAVAAYNRLATDGPGLLAMLEDLATNRLPGPEGLGREAVSALQPMDQTARQQSPAGQRQNETALRYWERQLRRIPARRLLGSTAPREPRYWEMAFTSPALYQAMHVVADRNQVATSPVLLAALAVAFGRYTGDSPFAVQAIVSNRFRPGLGKAVSPQSQGCLCVVDVADATFDEVVQRAEESATKAHLNAYYDPEQLDRLVAEVNRDLGENLDLSFFFSDRRFHVPRQDPGALPPPEAAVRALTAASTFELGAQTDRFNEKFFLHVDDVPDVIRLLAVVDTHHLSPAHAEACLRSIEQIVVDAAFDADARTGVRLGMPAR